MPVCSLSLYSSFGRTLLTAINQKKQILAVNTNVEQDDINARYPVSSLHRLLNIHGVIVVIEAAVRCSFSSAAGKRNGR
jgi:hypothetical protein